MRIGGINSQAARTETSNAMTTSVVEEAGNVFLAGNNRAHSNRRSKKDRGSNGAPSTEGRVCSMKPICHEGGQEQ